MCYIYSMKEFTGDKIVRGAKAVAALKEYFESETEMYDKLIKPMKLVKYVKHDDSSSDLVYEGVIDDVPLTFTVKLTKKLKISGYRADFANGKTLYLLTEEGRESYRACGTIAAYPRECSGHWNFETIEDEMYLWLHSVNKDFKDCPVRLHDWRRLNPEKFSEFDAAARKIEETSVIYTLRFNNIIKNFTKNRYDNCEVRTMAGIEANGTPYLGVDICYMANDEHDDYAKRIIHLGKETTIMPRYPFPFYGVKFYTVEEANKYLEDVQSRVNAEQDRIAAEHGIKWRGLEFDDNGPVKSEKEQKEFEAELIPKLMDFISKKTFDFRKFFTADEMTSSSLGEYDFDSKEAIFKKPITVQKKKRNKWVPHEAYIKAKAYVKFSIRRGEYGYKNFLANGDGETESVNVCLEFPFTYRTLDGKYLTFDEALKHSDGGPIDIHWRPYPTSFNSLVSEWQRDPERNRIAHQILTEYPGKYNGDDFKNWCNEHYPDYFDQDATHILGLLTGYQEQFGKFIAYTKEREAECSTSE